MARSLRSPRIASSNIVPSSLLVRYIAGIYPRDISKRYMAAGPASNPQVAGSGILQGRGFGLRVGEVDREIPRRFRWTPIWRPGPGSRGVTGRPAAPAREHEEGSGQPQTPAQGPEPRGGV